MTTETVTSFPAMGSDASVVTIDASAPTQLATLAQRRLAELEAQWSRFRPGSDIARLNADRSRWHHVSAETITAIDWCNAAYAATGGLFDVTVIDALCDWGYATSFDQLAAHTTTAAHDTPSTRLAPQTDPAAGLAQARCGIDLGGIGKGLAAEWVCAQLHAADPTADVLIDIGGDIVTRGRGFHVDVDVPGHGIADDPRLSVLVEHGAIATSSVAKRRWVLDDGSPSHHLIDPATGAPSVSDLTQVTVIAAHGAWAEVFAKAALLAGSIEGPALVAGAGLAGLAVTASGDVVELGHWADHVARGQISA